MAWVTGIKQVTIFQPERDGKQAIPKPVRVVSSLLPHAIEGTLQPRTVLPENTGAGPCGTLARDYGHRGPGVRAVRMYRHAGGLIIAGGSLSWSFWHLVVPLQAWYAERNRPRDPLSRAGIQIGAKSGGGNGRCELW